MVDVCRLGICAGFELGDKGAVLQLLLVDRDHTVQVWEGLRTYWTATKNIATGAQFCCEL